MKQIKPKIITLGGLEFDSEEARLESKRKAKSYVNWFFIGATIGVLIYGVITAIW